MCMISMIITNKINITLKKKKQNNKIGIRNAYILLN